MTSTNPEIVRHLTSSAVPSTIASAILSALVICGCASGPDWEEPDVSSDLPSEFRRIPADAAFLAPAPADSAVAAESADSEPDYTGASAISHTDWFAQWDDPLLRSLLQRAASSNLTVRQAVERVEAARAALDSYRASLLPTLGASGSASRSRSFDPGKTASSYRAGADASWEIDLFGKNRRAAEAAQADLESAGWKLEDAMLSLRAELVSAYVALRLSQTALEIARENLLAEEDNAKIARAKGDSGFSSGADVAAAEAGVATSRASIPPREAAADHAARAIERLLAMPPNSLDAELAAATGHDVPAAPPVPSAAPAELLSRRPDVRAALSALHAATARVGEARAARFPSVDLSASFVLSAASLSAWSEALKTLAAGPSISAPIFRGGALAAAERRADAAAREALLAYRDTVLAAVHEAQNAWTSLSAEAARGADLETAVSRNEEALEAARAKYRAGTGDWTAVTVRQMALLSSRLSLAQHRADMADCAVSLVKALGGSQM